MTSRNGAAFTFPGKPTQLARISDLKTRKHLPLGPSALTNLVNILFPDTAFTYVQTRLISEVGATLGLKRAQDLGRGLFPPPHFSLQTALGENNPSRKTLETVSDMKMHNNVHNTLHLLPEKGWR